MQVLLIGSACGRLACLADALREGNQGWLNIITNYDNPTLSALGSVTTGNPADPAFIEDWVKRNVVPRSGPTFALISDEAPLAAGVVDVLQGFGIPAVGPTKELMLEASKIRTRQLLNDHDIPGNPVWRSFRADSASCEHMLEYIGIWMDCLSDNVVIKPDGLTGGKGVWVAGDHFQTRSEGLDYCRQILQSGSGLIVEDKLIGEEFSLQSASDGSVIVHFFPVQDCKRLLDGDLGPNTGGMGSWGSSHQLPVWLSKEILTAAQRINERVIHALQKESGWSYKGILYGNFIVCPPGILKLIEFNCRFGDPEIMNLIPLLEKPSFFDLIKSIAYGTLRDHEIKFRDGFTVVKYLVPEGHPTNPTPDIPVHFGGLTFDKNLRVHRGSLIRVTRGDVTNYVTTGSRALALVGIGDTIEQAEQIAERAASEVEGPLFHRKDIATPEFFARRNAQFAAISRDMVS